ncbi:MAG: GAF domain-containing sensor histidine kinase [Patescibacteria group bacterium]
MKEETSKEMQLLLEMFYDTSALLTLGPSLDDVLQEMFQKIKEQTKISSILIWLLDQKKEFFDLAASCHLPKAMIDIFKAKRLKSNQGTPSTVLKTRKFYLMKDILTDPRAVSQYVETVLKTKAPIRSIASFPMIAGGEGLGVFSFFFSGPKESISKMEFIIFSTIANQIASFIKNTEMLEEVKALDKIKSEFIFLAAHQLRTPLSATKWAMKMLIEGELGELNQKQKEFLENGYKSNERMVTLVNDLLNVASIEEGKFGYSFVLADFGEIISEAIEEQSLLIQKKNIEVNFQKSAGSFPKIKIDRQKMKLAIGNLLENAINYSRTGGSVGITLRRRGSFSVEVAIKDNGIGIPKEHLPRLFSKFFRAKNAIQIQPEGSGLGLFIAKNIIEKHGGEIRIESEEGKGTTVYFTLPLV